MAADASAAAAAAPQESWRDGREIDPPEGLPTGWKCIEKKYLSGPKAGQTYVRYFSGRHKAILTVKCAIRKDAEDKGLDPEEEVRKYEIMKQERAEQKERLKCEMAKRKEEALAAFHALFGTIDGPTAQALPGWRSRFEYASKTNESKVFYTDPEGKVWKHLADIEGHLASRMQGGEDLTELMATARAKADPHFFSKCITQARDAVYAQGCRSLTNMFGAKKAPPPSQSEEQKQPEGSNGVEATPAKPETPPEAPVSREPESGTPRDKDAMEVDAAGAGAPAAPAAPTAVSAAGGTADPAAPAAPSGGDGPSGAAAPATAADGAGGAGGAVASASANSAGAANGTTATPAVASATAAGSVPSVAATTAGGVAAAPAVANPAAPAGSATAAPAKPAAKPAAAPRSRRAAGKAAAVAPAPAITPPNLELDRVVAAATAAALAAETPMPVSGTIDAPPQAKRLRMVRKTPDPPKPVPGQESSPGPKEKVDDKAAPKEEEAAVEQTPPLKRLRKGASQAANVEASATKSSKSPSTMITGYMLFGRRERTRIKNEGITDPKAQLKEMALRWRTLPAEERQKWVVEARDMLAARGGGALHGKAKALQGSAAPKGAQKAEDARPKWLTGYMLFCSGERKRIAKEGPVEHKSLMTGIGQRWRLLSQEERDRWDAEAKGHPGTMQGSLGSALRKKLKPVKRSLVLESLMKNKKPRHAPSIMEEAAKGAPPPPLPPPALAPLAPAPEPAPQPGLEDAPKGHKAWRAVRHCPTTNTYYFEMIRGAERIRFQTTIYAAGASKENAARIARLCYMEFERGADKDQVLQFRTEQYRKCAPPPMRRGPEKQEVFRNLHGEVVTVSFLASGQKQSFKHWSELEPSDVDALPGEDLAAYERELRISTRRSLEERIARLETMTQKTTLTGWATAASQSAAEGASSSTAPVPSPTGEEGVEASQTGGRPEGGDDDARDARSLQAFLAISPAERRMNNATEISRLEKVARIADAGNFTVGERRARLKELLWELRAQAAPAKGIRNLRSWMHGGAESQEEPADMEVEASQAEAQVEAEQQGEQAEAREKSAEAGGEAVDKEAAGSDEKAEGVGEEAKGEVEAAVSAQQGEGKGTEGEAKVEEAATVGEQAGGEGEKASEAKGAAEEGEAKGAAEQGEAQAAAQEGEAKGEGAAEQGEAKGAVEKGEAAKGASEEGAARGEQAEGEGQKEAEAAAAPAAGAEPQERAREGQGEPPAAAGA